MNNVKTLAIEFKADVKAQNVDEMFPDYAQEVDRQFQKTRTYR